MTQSPPVAEDTGLYRADFEVFAAARTAADPSWLRRQREESMERFQERGFPTTAEEDWRFTNVAPIARTAFQRATGAGRGPVRGDAPANGPQIVFVDGRHSPELSTVPATGGLEVRSLAEVLSR